MLVVVTTAVVLFLVMMVMMVIVFHLGQGMRQGIFSLHSLPQLRAGQLIPGGGDQGGVIVMLPQQGNSSVQLCLGDGIGAGKNDGRSGFYLVVVEFAEVLHIDLDLAGIHNGNGITQLHIVPRYFLHGGNDIGQLANTGGLNHDAVGRILVDDLGQRFAEIANQGAADAAGVHLSDVDARILQESAVDADLAEFILDQHQFFACVGFLDHLFDKGGLTRAQETGIDINFHRIHLLYLDFYILYHRCQTLTSQNSMNNHAESRRPDMGRRLSILTAPESAAFDHPAAPVPVCLPYRSLPLWSLFPLRYPIDGGLPSVSESKPAEAAGEMAFP